MDILNPPVESSRVTPYLLVLSRILVRADHNNKLVKGVEIARNSPPLTHLLLAYDQIIFAQATKKGQILLLVWTKSK